MTNDIIINVQGLGKRFKLYDSPGERLKEWLSFGRVVRHKDFWALRNVSFEIKRGECFGVIGENGAGKSTLLKILTGAMWPTEGSVETKGRVLSLLELGTGFNPELTGRQNVSNSASLLGFPKDYLTRERMKQIEEFADIGEFFDRPVKLYSSGMYVRLAFSMFMFMEPDIFIIDEALSVGDIFFSQKCFTKIRELMEKGVTFIFVSHDLNAVQNLSNRVMVLNHGNTTFIGNPEKALLRFTFNLGKSILSRKGLHATKGKKEKKPDKPSFLINPEKIISHSILNGKSSQGDGRMRIIAVRVTNKKGEDTFSVPLSEKLMFYFYVKAEKEISLPGYGLMLFDKTNNLIFSSSTRHLGIVLPSLQHGEETVIGLNVKMTVQAGEYTFNLHCGELDPSKPNVGVMCDLHEGLGPITVTFDYQNHLAPFYGIAQLPMSLIQEAELPS